MASNTENLNLLMKNPSTDGADTFNVQTMLNENWQKIDNNAGTVAQTLANILKPTTPPIIGLPSSTTPDGMFQALGNTGELHVWRKTVTTSQEIPAGYTLGDVITNTDTWFYVNSNDIAVIHYASSIAVSNDLVVSLVSENTINVSNTFSDSDLSVFDVCKGKFAYVSGGSFNARPSIFFIPSDATFHRSGISGNVYILADKEQRVNAHGIIPAGTTITYPVSTNPNAYQEGSNANTIIEYLGKLGDKARVQVVSYVGTGTYGESNPNSLTFDFVPKVVMIRCGGDTKIFDAIYGMRDVTVVLSAGYYVTVEWSKKTLSWYSPNSASEQMNYAGDKYYAAAIG